MTGLACDCVCGQKERSRVASTVDVAVLADPVSRLDSWELIKEEMASSNVIQRKDCFCTPHQNQIQHVKCILISERTMYMSSTSKYSTCERDSVLLATKLSPMIVKMAQDKEKDAKDVKLWALEARRNLVLVLLDCWVEKCAENATVEVLLTALSHPNFKDMKIRVEKMINMS